jgi:hypothetical protein
MLRTLRTLCERSRGGSEDRGSRNRGLNKALGDELRIDRSNQTVASLSVGQHWRSPSIPANNLLGENPLSAKRMIVKFGFGLRDCAEKGAASKK